MSSLRPRTGSRLLLPLFLLLRFTLAAQPVAIVSTNAPLCAGAPELRLFESSGTAIWWKWSGPNNFTSQQQNPVIQQPGVQAAGTYRVTISDVEGLTATASLWVSIHQPEAMVCNDLVLISPNQSGYAEVSPETVLEGSYDFQFYSVSVFTNTGENIGNQIPCSYQGQTLTYRVTDLCNGNMCLGNLKIDDKAPPQLNCDDIIFTCGIADYSPDYLYYTLGIAAAYPEVNDNCPPVTLSFVDQFYNLPCALPINALAVSSAWLRRDWRAVDVAGNVSTCGQAIYFVRRHLSDVRFPADTTVLCSQPKTTPEFTGAPFLTEYGRNFSIFPNQAFCEFSTGYKDVIVDNCDGSWKIEREWTVLEDCPPTGQPQFITHTQLIKVVDLQGPMMICPAPDTVSINPLTCCAVIDLPDVLVSDHCSRISEVEAVIQTFDIWTGDSTGAYGYTATLSTFPANNLWNPDTLAVFGLSDCLPPGSHTVTYQATDDCGNNRACSFPLVVRDYVPPAVACDSYTKVALTNDGLAEVFATTFDDGSYDLCCNLQLFARRAAGDCQGDPDEFDPSVWFCCSDIGDTVEVIMRAYDCADNYSDCLVRVYVEDKIRPVCQAPEAITVECATFDPTLGSYGFAEAVDNCCLDTITVTVNYNQFDSICNRGTIIRTFRAFDCAGNSSQCTQKITTEYLQYFYLKMPDDKIVTTCDGTGNYGEPSIHYEDCELIGLSYEDQVFTVVPDGCYRIDRHWKIINWCTYNPNGECIQIPNPDISQQRPFVLPGPIISPIGMTGPWAPTITLVNPSDPAPTNFGTFWQQNANCYEYKQMILVFDTKDPIIEGCPHGVANACDYTENHPALWHDAPWWDPLTNSHNLCEGPVDIAITASDACTMADVRFRFLLFLDLDRNGTLETVINSSNPPPPGMVYYGNALNPNFSGGELRAFDQRAVPVNQKYNFTLTETVTGNKRTAALRWKTAAELNTPGSPGVLPELPYGRHRVKWLVEDGCTNESLCEYNVEVKDCKKPTVVCINGLSVNIMANGMITLWASDFLQYANDNCTPNNFLQFGIRRTATGNSFPQDADGNPITSVTFDCADIGSQPVELWSRDLAGNADYCETIVVVQDNLGACSAVGKVSGALRTEEGTTVENATIEIAGNSPVAPNFTFQQISDVNGQFLFPAIPMPCNYTLTPLKDDNPANGVTTYDLVEISKHILGIKPLGSPYRMIAADANRSNSITSFDIVELRKLILGIYTDLPSNTSWRFVDQDFTFPNPANPFQSDFPEQISVPNMALNRLQEDFVAVKIGDVNGSVVPSLQSEGAERQTLPPAVLKVNSNKNGLLEPGQILELMFNTPESLHGFQMTLSLPGLIVEEIMPHAGIQMDQFAVFPTEEALTIACETTGKVSFTLRCKVKQPGYWRQMVHISSQITRAEAYLGSDSQMQRALPVLIAGIPAAFEVYAPRPNPFQDQTAISFYLPEKGDVSITLFDENGRTIWRQSADFEQGFNVFKIDLKQFVSGPLLFFRLESSSGTASGKLLRER